MLYLSSFKPFTELIFLEHNLDSLVFYPLRAVFEYGLFVWEVCWRVGHQGMEWEWMGLRTRAARLHRH